MNGRTATVLRKVAQKRGKNSPRYVRKLKRNWNKLSDAEKELKRIEYQTELDDYESSIRYGFDSTISEKERKISIHIADAKTNQKMYKRFKIKVSTASFGQRLRYLFNPDFFEVIK